MLTHIHGRDRNRSSMVISAKFGIKVADMVQELELDKEKEHFMEQYSTESIKEYLLLNHEIADIIKCSTEIIEFQIIDGGMVFNGKGLL